MKLWKMGAGLTIALGAIAATGSGPALAQDFSITIPKETDRAPIGTVIPIYSESVPPEFVGQTCTVFSTDVSNNPSLHDNDLIVSSQNTITVFEIEDGQGTKSASGLLLGSSVSFSVAINNTDASDNNAIDPETGTTFPPNTGTYSAALLIEFECDPPPTTTTTQPPTTTTTQPPTTTTTQPPTTTTQPPTSTTQPPTTQPPTTIPVQEFAFGSAGPVCVDDHPFIQYSLLNVPEGTLLDITITDANGVDVLELADQPTSGTILWPGASIDPPDWPGWDLVDGVWVEDPTDEVLREPLTIVAEYNPTAGPETIAYPEATEECADPPDETTTTTTVPGTTAPPTTTPTTLPQTGSDATTNGVLLAIMFLSAGGSIALAARRRTI